MDRNVLHRFFAGSEGRKRLFSPYLFVLMQLRRCHLPVRKESLPPVPAWAIRSPFLELPSVLVRQLLILQMFSKCDICVYIIIQSGQRYANYSDTYQCRIISFSVSRSFSVRWSPFDKYLSVEPYSFFFLWKAKSSHVSSAPSRTVIDSWASVLRLRAI